MITRIAKYRIQPDARADVDAAIRAFVAGIARAEPDTAYRAYVLPDGVSFLHVMSFPSEAAEEAHRTAPHTLAFVAALYPRCVETPHFTALTEIR